jgi:LysM repeat protein
MISGEHNPMTRWKRLFYYLIINILVSACTTLAVLYTWERTHPLDAGSFLLAARSLSSPTAPPILATFAASSNTPTTTPTPFVTKYQVQEGDTLGDLSVKFGVPVAEIMKLNSLKDANALAVGMVIFIPVATEEVTAEPTAAQGVGTPEITDTPLPPGSVIRLVIANVFGAGDLATERVRLERKGEGDLSLANWQLRDENGHIYTFPQLTLFPGGAVDVYTGDGVNGVDALYWGLDQPVWETGETVTLVDAQGNVQAIYQVP